MSEKEKGHDKTEAATGAGSLQSTKSAAEKAELRKKIAAIRGGHATGGYVETEALKAEEKKLDKILRAELAAAKEKHGYSPDPKFKHPEIRAIELELNGLAYKPELVVKDQ